MKPLKNFKKGIMSRRQILSICDLDFCIQGHITDLEMVL